MDRVKLFSELQKSCRFLMAIALLGAPVCAFGKDAPKQTSLAPAAPAPMPERKPSAAPATKADLINRLKALQSRHNLEIQALEDAARKRLQDSATLSLKADDLSLADKKLVRLTEQLGNIDTKRSELLARREFLDQLILAVDAKWNNQPLQGFLEHQLLDMAVSDLTNPRGSSRLWKFVTYLSVAVREVPEPREDVVGVLESYMNFSSVLNPKTPAEFLSNRNYSNGAVSVSARPVDRAALGDHLEKRMKELKIQEASLPHNLRGADIELRMNPIAPPPSEDSQGQTPDDAKIETKPRELETNSQAAAFLDAK